VPKPRDEEHFAVFTRHEDGTPRHLDSSCRPCRRAYQRERYRTDPARRANQLAAARRQRERIRADPEELERQRARRRVWNATQRRRRKGERVPDGRRPQEDRPQGPRWAGRLPAAPLLELVDALAEREGAETVCARLGLSGRTVRAWRNGERGEVRVDVADRALLALGLNWDVWSEECLAA
jgi:hypothetical protein